MNNLNTLLLAVIAISLSSIALRPLVKELQLKQRLSYCQGLMTQLQGANDTGFNATRDAKHPVKGPYLRRCGMFNTSDIHRGDIPTSWRKEP